MALDVTGKGGAVGIGCVPTAKFQVQAGPVTVSVTQTAAPGGLRGIHYDRPSSDLTPHGHEWLIDSVPVYGVGMDFDSATYPIPDLVIANAIYLGATPNNLDVVRFRHDDMRCEWGLGVGHPGNPSQLTVRGGTAALPYNALGLVQFSGAGLDAAQLVQGGVTSNQTTIGFGGVFGAPTWRIGEDVGAANTAEFGLWSVSAGAYRWQVGATGKFLIQAGGLGIPNRAAKTTLALPGTVTGAVEVFDASGNSLGSIPVYANGSFS